MELVDLIQKMSTDMEGILEPYYKELAATFTFEYISQKILAKFKEYEYSNIVYKYELRVRGAKDLVIAFEAEGLDIAFLYLHMVERYSGAELKFNVDIYPLKR